ncbi:hypothetical protein [Pseudarthrobacter chlorophenolicus]|uniref:hypothetical protein n=1 Tax=Pseudarthrobacter chlorophenolicus TaxID=85085 RepID=UPI00126A71E0|nr:hypothetical protein [Pseudarthrobacter chlorophenolicus]
MTLDRLVLATCVRLTPKGARSMREEQWQADLLDGPDLGISRSALLTAVARTSLTLRGRDLLYRGSSMLSQLTKGEKLKTLAVALGTAAVLAGIAVAGTQGSGASGTDSTAVKAPMEGRPLGGYEGWWTSTPLSGDTSGLPEETIAVNTSSGKIVDVFNRADNAAGLTTSASSVRFDVVSDPAWPSNSVVIIDTSSGNVIEIFPVDGNGSPIILDKDGKRLNTP